MNRILEIKNLKKSYGEHIILDEIDFDINPGEIIGLIGRNGAGKTTLMKSILGLVSIDEGEIIFDGHKNYHREKKLMDSIGYLLDCKLFEYMNAFDNLFIQEQYNGSNLSKKELSVKIEEVLKFVELENNRKKVSEYSFGMKQRLGLALALLGNTKFLVLDEPFVGLDPLGVETFRKFIYKLSKEKGVAILISSHQLSEIESMCEKYLFISEKTIKKHSNINQKSVQITIGSCTANIRERINELWDDVVITDSTIKIPSTGEILNSIVHFICQENLEIVDIDISKSNISDLFAEEMNK